jgi:hypothetical protein
MECKHIENLLSAYLEDELNREEKQKVEEHLNICSDCAELFALLRETTESLTDFPEVEMSEDLVGRLYEIPEKKKKFRFSFGQFLKPAFQPVFAAIALLVVLTSIYIFHPNRSQINKSIDKQIHLGFSKIEKLYSKAESFTHSLGEYKDNILVSIKNTKLFRGSEEN